MSADQHAPLTPDARQAAPTPQSAGSGPTLADCIQMWHANHPGFEMVAECADPETSIWPGEVML